MPGATLTASDRSMSVREGAPDRLVETHFLHRGAGLEFDMEVSWLRRHLPPGDGPVLDVGCGIGALFPVIGESRVVGVDHNEAGMALTRQRFPGVTLWHSSADHIPSADGEFGAITCQHVIEHLPDAHRAVAEWFRVLKPGGVLLVLTPNARFADPSVYDDPTHVRIFEGNALREAMVRAGFAVADLRSLGLPWFRQYQRVRGSWRLRRLVTERAGVFSDVPFLRWRGQTLCCAARRPVR